MGEFWQNAACGVCTSVGKNGVENGLTMQKTSNSQAQVRCLEKCISGNLRPEDLVTLERLSM